MITVCLLLWACRGPETGIDANLDLGEEQGAQGDTHRNIQGTQWKSHIMPISHPKGSLGGLDITYSRLGYLQAAFLIKELDIGAGATFYRLYYGDNRSGSWNLSIVKSSLSQFYRSSYANNESNPIKILSDKNGDPIILYVNGDDHLSKYELDNGNYREEILINEEVGSFAATYESTTDSIHIASMKKYYNAREVRYHSFTGNYLRESFVYSGNISSGGSTNHLEIKLYQGTPLIFVKYYDSTYRTGRFIVIKNQVAYNIANGVNPSGVFNVYWNGGKLKSCYRNAINERYSIEIGPNFLEGTTQREFFSDTRINPYHCLVTPESDMRAVRYNLNYGYGNYFETTTGSMKFPIDSIRFVDLRNQTVFVGGLDEESGRPTFLEKTN